MELNLSDFCASLGVIAIIILLGFFLGRRKLISVEANKNFVNLLLSVFMPASLFVAFPATANEDLLNLFFLGLLAGFIVMIILIVISRLILSSRKV